MEPVSCVLMAYLVLMLRFSASGLSKCVCGRHSCFRGSLTTDIEKGVMITTGTFTKAAREEASNAGKQQIDLIDGEEFINKRIEYRLGVHEKIVYEVDKLFFEKV